MKPTYLNRFICLLLLLFAGTPWALQAQNPPPKKVCIVKNCLYPKVYSIKDLLYLSQYRTKYKHWPYPSFLPKKTEIITDSYQNAFPRLFYEKQLDRTRHISIDVVTDLLASMLEKNLVAQGCLVEVVSAFDWTKFARETTHSRYISFMTPLVVGQTPELTTALRKKTGADIIVSLDGNMTGHTIHAKTKGSSSLEMVTGTGCVSMSVNANIAKGDVIEKSDHSEMLLSEWANKPLSEFSEINLIDNIMACSQKIAEQLSEQLTGNPTSKQEVVTPKKRVCIVSNIQSESKNFQNFEKFIVKRDMNNVRHLPDYLGDIETEKWPSELYLAHEVFSSPKVSTGRDIVWKTLPVINTTTGIKSPHAGARRFILPSLDPNYLIDYMTFQLKMDGYEVSVYFPWDIMALAKETGAVVKPKKPTSERGVVIDEPLLAALRKATGAETIIVGEGIHYDVDIKSERSKEDAVTGFSKMDLSYKTTIYQQGQPAKENLFEGDFETHWNGMTRDQVWQVYELPLMYQQCIEEITGQIRTTYKDI